MDNFNSPVLLSDVVRQVASIIENEEVRQKLSKEITEEYLFSVETKEGSIPLERNNVGNYFVNPQQFLEWLDDKIKPLKPDSKELEMWKECTSSLTATHSINVYRAAAYRKNKNGLSKKEMENEKKGLLQKWMAHEKEIDILLYEKDAKIEALQIKLENHEGSSSKNKKLKSGKRHPSGKENKRLADLEEFVNLLERVARVEGIPFDRECMACTKEMLLEELCIRYSKKIHWKIGIDAFEKMWKLEARKKICDNIDSGPQVDPDFFKPFKKIIG